MAAIRFLKEGCGLGRRALNMRMREYKSEGEGEGESEGRERKEEGWKSLNEQLFRRWELLGICYAKMGDRRVRVLHHIFSVSFFSLLFPFSSPHMKLSSRV